MSTIVKSSEDRSGAVIVARSLVKDFPGVRAVDHLSFAVKAGEIFGLARSGRCRQNYDFTYALPRC